MRIAMNKPAAVLSVLASSLSFAFALSSFLLKRRFLNSTVFNIIAFSINSNNVGLHVATYPNAFNFLLQPLCSSYICAMENG